MTITVTFASQQTHTVIWKQTLMLVPANSGIITVRNVNFMRHCFCATLWLTCHSLAGSAFLPVCVDYLVIFVRTRVRLVSKRPLNLGNIKFSNNLDNNELLFEWLARTDTHIHTQSLITVDHA